MMSQQSFKNLRAKKRTIKHKEPSSDDNSENEDDSFYTESLTDVKQKKHKIGISHSKIALIDLSKKFLNEKFKSSKDFKEERRKVFSRFQFSQEEITDYYDLESPQQFEDWLSRCDKPCPFESVEIDEVVGDKFSSLCIINDELKPVKLQRYEEHRGEISVVPSQNFESVDNSTRIFLQNGDFIPGNEKNILSSAKLGSVHSGLKIGRVGEGHPHWKVENSVTEGHSGYTVYTTQNISKGEILGMKAGFVTLGYEFEDHCAKKADDFHSQIEGMDLNGPNTSKGGWIDDSCNSFIHLYGLVLDSGRKKNLLGYVGDYREDPISHPDQKSAESGRKINAALVELMVEGWPYIYVVAISTIGIHDEVIVDFGADYWKACQPAVKRAEVIHGISKMVNENLDKFESLNTQFHPMVTENRENKQRVLEARTAAVLIQCLIEESGGDSIIPLHQPGALDQKVVKKFLQQTKIYDERTNSRREQQSDLEDASSDSDSDAEFDENADARLGQILSELQDLVFRDSFCPKRAKDVEGKIIYVENENCEDLLRIKAKYGDAIASEVCRAWLEFQEFQSYCHGTNFVPWNIKKNKPLELSDIIILLGVQLGVETKEELDSGIEDSMKKSLQEKISYYQKSYSALLKHETREDKNVKGRQR